MRSIEHVSVWEGYAAARIFLDKVVYVVPSYDLTSLWADMEVVAGESHDRAMIDDWSEHWGEATQLRPVEALEVLTRFIAFERGWSKDSRVHQLLDALHSGRPFGDVDLKQVWNNALSGIASSGSPMS